MTSFVCFDTAFDGTWSCASQTPPPPAPGSLQQMGDASRTSEARMRAAAQDVVATLDRHGDGLTRDEAITVLGLVTGTYALAWGGEEEVVLRKRAQSVEEQAS